LTKAKEIFKGVYRVNGRLATLNLVKGNRVYGEDLVHDDGKEYRLWNPYRSKLAAAILKGLRQLHIGSGSKVLYLGAATGTTSSHVSDIVGANGVLFCVEVSERSMRELVRTCEARPNMLPILEDARNVEAYANDVGTCDIIYQDVSAPDQARILNWNSRLLKKGGYAYVAIKSQSIDVTEKPAVIYKKFLNEASQNFKVVESIDIKPFSQMHLFVVLQKI